MRFEISSDGCWGDADTARIWPKIAIAEASLGGRALRVALGDVRRHERLGGPRREFEVIHHSAELGERCRFDFPHRVTAMDLHCGFSDAYISGNLLVQPTRRDLSQNDTLACR